MPIRFEAYTPVGLLAGTAVPDGRLVDLLETFASIAIEGATILGFEGQTEAADEPIEVTTDDLLAVVAAPDTVLPIHANWQSICLVVGPYVVEGLLPTLPGFDPARALARPTGTFVLLSTVRVGLAGDSPSTHAAHEAVWVNRYAAEQVETELDFTVFFPGAVRTTIVRGRGPGPRATRRAEANLASFAPEPVGATATES